MCKSRVGLGEPHGIGCCQSFLHVYSSPCLSDGETGAVWILLEKRLEILYKDPKKAKFEVQKRMKGSELEGLTYVPPFDYFISVCWRKDIILPAVNMNPSRLAQGQGIPCCERWLRHR